MASNATPPALLDLRLRPGSTIDVTVAGAALAGSLVLARVVDGASGVFHGGSASLDVIGLLLFIVATVPLVAWRRSPFGVFLLTAAASAMLAALDHPVFPLGATAALYFLAASRDQARPWSPTMTTAVLGLLAAYLGATAIADAALPWIELSHTSLAWTVAWFAGDRARLRREQLADLRQRVARAERDAEQDRLLAVAEERTRIARDLHDSAGHAVNVIAVRAGAARLRHDREPNRSIAALEAIEELARHTVEDIDHIVGVLRHGRSEGASVESPLGLASLDDLVALHAAAGLDVSVEMRGQARPLGAATDQAVYRVLQEALTNAARHGGGTALVEITFDESTVGLTVTNPVAAGGGLRSQGGHGIVGMRERVSLLGGDLGAERSNGEFRLLANIPDEGHP